MESLMIILLYMMKNKRTSNLPFRLILYVLFVGGRAGYKNFQLVVDAIFGNIF